MWEVTGRWLALASPLVVWGSCLSEFVWCRCDCRDLEEVGLVWGRVWKDRRLLDLAMLRYSFSSIIPGMKTLLEKGLHPARTLLKPGNPLSARTCCSQSSSLLFKSFTVILVNLSEDFSKVPVFVFRLHHSWKKAQKETRCHFLARSLVEMVAFSCEAVWLSLYVGSVSASQWPAEQ